MNYFIIIKQIVDIIYEFKILDYMMVIFAAALFIYSFAKKKIYRDIRGFIVPADAIVLGLCILFTISFLKDPAKSINQYFKTISAFALYFLGRVYGEDIVKYKKGLAITAYILIYINFIYKLFEKTYELRTGEWLYRQKQPFINSGGLYYYKTDLAVAIVIAIIFIYAFAKNTWFKYFTIIVPTSITLFSAKARIGQVILIIEILFIVLLELRKKIKAKWTIRVKFINVIGIIAIILLTGLFALFQLSIIKTCAYDSLQISDELKQTYESIFHNRHIIWWDSMHYFSNQDLLTRLTGIDMWSESIRNATGDRFHCQYFKNIYATGYIGSYLYLIFIIMLFRSIVIKKGNTLNYLVVAFWIMFLIMSVSMEAFEYTQMSWFPFLFAGAIMSKESTKKSTKEKIASGE